MAAKVQRMEDALKIVVAMAVERKFGTNPNKREVARVCRIPYHALVDVLRGHIQRPDPSILEGLAGGLDITYDDLALAAYQRLPKPREEHADSAGADDTEPLEKAAPAASNDAWSQAPGRKRLKVSGATS